MIAAGKTLLCSRMKRKIVFASRRQRLVNSARKNNSALLGRYSSVAESEEGGLRPSVPGLQHVLVRETGYDVSHYRLSTKATMPRLT